MLKWTDISKLYRACETFLPSYSKTSLNLRRYAHGPLTGRLMDIAHRNGNSCLKPQAPIWLAGFQTIYVIQSAQVFNHFFSLLMWYHLLQISVSKTSCKQTAVGCFTCQSDGLFLLGLHDKSHVIAMRISSVKPVLWLVVNLHHMPLDGVAFNTLLRSDSMRFVLFTLSWQKQIRVTYEQKKISFGPHLPAVWM